MNKRFNNKNRMFQLVAEVFETNKQVWESIPLIVLLVGEYKVLLEKIQLAAKAAGIVLTGATESKLSTLDALSAVLYKFCAALSLFAVRTKNQELHAKVFFPESDITRKRQGDLMIFADEIIGLVNQHKAALLDGYPVTEADVSKLTDLFTLAKKEISVPEVKYTDKKNAQAELEKTFDETDDFLEKQLDKAVDLLRSKSEVFYKAYYSSRNIKNIGIRHETPSTPETVK